MSRGEARSSARPDYGDDPETPTGIWIIAVLGLLGAGLGVLTGITTALAGSFHPAIGAGLVVLALAQAITMLALVGLTPWAWYATILLYAISAVANLVSGDGGGTLVSLIVIGYVATQRELFVGE